MNIILQPAFFKVMYINAMEGNEFCKNQLENYNAIVLEFDKKLASNDHYAKEIERNIFELLRMLKEVIKSRYEAIKKVAVEIYKHDPEFFSSEMDKVLKMDEVTWKKYALYMLNLWRLNREAQTFLRLAQKGNVKYQYKIGRYYIKGLAVSPNGIESNGADGMKWLRKASEEGNGYWAGYASFRIARVYIKGEAGFKQDYKEANRWLQKAMVQGNKQAILDFAINCYEGLGMSKDIEKSKKLLRKVSEKGDKQASDLLNQINKFESFKSRVQN